MVVSHGSGGDGGGNDGSGAVMVVMVVVMVLQHTCSSSTSKHRPTRSTPKTDLVSDRIVCFGRLHMFTKCYMFYKKLPTFVQPRVRTALSAVTS